MCLRCAFWMSPPSNPISSLNGLKEVGFLVVFFLFFEFFPPITPLQIERKKLKLGMYIEWESLICLFGGLDFSAPFHPGYRPKKKMGFLSSYSFFEFVSCIIPLQIELESRYVYWVETPDLPFGGLKIFRPIEPFLRILLIRKTRYFFFNRLYNFQCCIDWFQNDQFSQF